MSRDMPELEVPGVSNSALSIAVGAAHYWKKRADEASKHSWRILILGVVIGVCMAQIGPTVAAWASSAF